MTRLLPAFLVSLLVVTSALPSTAHAQASQPLDRIAAIVDEDVILQSELDRAVANVRGQYAGREAQLPPADVLQRQVLERLVLVKLQVARAETQRHQGRRRRRSSTRHRQHCPAERHPASMACARSWPPTACRYGDFRRSVREEITVQRLRQSFAQSRISVSEGCGRCRPGPANRRRYPVPPGAHPGRPCRTVRRPSRSPPASEKIDGVKSLIDKGELDFSAAAVRLFRQPQRAGRRRPRLACGQRNPQCVRPADQGPATGSGGRSAARPQRLPVAEVGGSAHRLEQPARHSWSPNTTPAPSWCGSTKPRAMLRPRPRSKRLQGARRRRRGLRGRGQGSFG